MTTMHLDALLADQPLTGGLEPRLGDTHLHVLTIVGFPTATTPGPLNEMNRLAVLVCLEKVGPILKRARLGERIGESYGISAIYA